MSKRIHQSYIMAPKSVFDLGVIIFGITPVTQVVALFFHTHNPRAFIKVHDHRRRGDFRPQMIALNRLKAEVTSGVFSTTYRASCYIVCDPRSQPSKGIDRSRVLKPEDLAVLFPDDSIAMKCAVEEAKYQRLLQEQAEYHVK